MKTSNNLSVILAIGAALVGLGAGYLLFHRGQNGATTPTGQSATAEGPTTLYTCGMHPEVIQDHPGTCPQCGMTLTPLQTDEAEEGNGGGKDRKVLYWVAPMDPSYIKDKPGKSPMGMDLVPVYEDEVKGGPTVKIDPTTQQNMGIRTAPVEKGPLVHQVRAVGNVGYDETKIGIVSLKVGGYIDELFVSETGVAVKKGQPLFSMYAPEVVQAQEEYLLAKRSLEKSDAVDPKHWRNLLAASRLKLLRWDISEDQIHELEKRGRPEKNVVWRSRFDGIVLHKNAVEGAYFKPGDPLYKIAGLDTIWVEVSIYEYEFPWIKTGQPARMELPYYPGEVFQGVVDFIYPYLDPRTRDLKVRLVFDNPGRELLPDMYVTVIIDSKLADEAILVPGEAVLDTGTRQVAFVARGKGHFEPRNITVGVEGEGGRREVVMGLVPGEYVVTSGQFLLDSESKIKEAIQKMLESRKQGGNAGESEARGAPSGSLAALPKKDRSAFKAPPGLVPVVGDVCPVMGGEPQPDVFVDYKGYRVFFCCTGCPPRFLAEPEKYMQKLRRMGAVPSTEPESGTAPPDARFSAPEGLIPVVPKACPVMGGEPQPDVYVDYKGYRIFFCCAGCPEEFEKDPETYMKKLREEGAIPAETPTAAPAPAPAPAPDDRFKAPEGLVPVVPKACPVMGGEPQPDVYVDYEGYRIFLCCAGCPEEFEKDPETYMKKLREEGAIPAETPTAAPAPAPAPAPDDRFKAPEGLVPVVPKACPVMGGEPQPDVYVDYEGYRIFLCCAGCPEEFEKDPETYMKKLREEGAIPAETPTAAPAPAPAPAPDDRFKAPEGLIPVVPKACPVMGGEPQPDVYVDYKGYRFFFCCQGCPEKFLADPGRYIEELRAQGIHIGIHD